MEMLKKEDSKYMNIYDSDDDEPGIKTRSRRKEKKSFISRKASIKQTYSCNYCSYRSYKRYLLIRHMKSHSDERPYKCKICEKAFKTVASLQNHINTHTGTKPHKCKHCKSAFTTSGELVRHVRYKHTHEKPHTCSMCEYASVELSKLKRHIRSHTGERPYQCPQCTYASPDTFKLKRHLRIHTGERPYECDICHARFTQSNSLKSHKLIHSAANKPVFKCEHCKTTCGRQTDLRIHMKKLHTSDKPIICKKCGKSFPDRYTYKVHNKTHIGEKCFKCNICPYASVALRHLESHMLIHTDQKPFTCNDCDKCFRQKQLLRRHQNIYHNPNYVRKEPQKKIHECPECKRGFRYKGNLIRHSAIHDSKSFFTEKAIALKLGRQKRILVMKEPDKNLLNVLDANVKIKNEEINDIIPKNEIVDDSLWDCLKMTAVKNEELRREQDYDGKTLLDIKEDRENYFGFIDDDVNDFDATLHEAANNSHPGASIYIKSISIGILIPIFFVTLYFLFISRYGNRPSNEEISVPDFMKMLLEMGNQE